MYMQYIDLLPSSVRLILPCFGCRGTPTAVYGHVIHPYVHYDGVSRSQTELVFHFIIVVSSWWKELRGSEGAIGCAFPTLVQT